MTRSLGHSILALTCAVASALPAVHGSEPAGALELEDAVGIALERNHRLAAADAGLRGAEAGVVEARAHRLPTVRLDETFSETTNPVYVFSNKLGQEEFGPEDFDPSRLNRPDALSNWNTKLEVRQPIWTGGRVSAGVAAAEAMRAAESSRRERTRQEVVHQVIESYTGAVLARHHLEVALEARETAREHVRMVQDLRDAGLVVQSDLLQARVRASEVEEMVARAESGVAVADAALNLALGRDLDTPLRLPEALGDRAFEEAPLEEWTRRARDNRPDLAAAGHEVAAAARAARASRAGSLPTVGATGQVEANAEDFVGTDGSNWSVFVGMSWTPFDGNATRARVRQAKEREIRARNMRDLMEQSVGLEVRQAFHDRTAARKRLEQSEHAVSLADESLRIVEDRYREGLDTLSQLLDAETARTRARTREVAARRDVLLSEARLQLAAGML